MIKIMLTMQFMLSIKEKFGWRKGEKNLGDYL